MPMFWWAARPSLLRSPKGVGQGKHWIPPGVASHPTLPSAVRERSARDRCAVRAASRTQVSSLWVWLGGLLPRTVPPPGAGGPRSITTGDPKPRSTPDARKGSRSTHPWLFRVCTVPSNGLLRHIAAMRHRPEGRKQPAIGLGFAIGVNWRVESCYISGRTDEAMG